MSSPRFDPPRPEEIISPNKAAEEAWFERGPFEARGEPWEWVSETRSRELRRLSRSFARLFELSGTSGEWFSASRDTEERVEAFSSRVLQCASGSDAVYVFKQPQHAVCTTVRGFLACWTRLRVEPYGFVIVPLDLAFWLEVAGTGTARISRRAR